jgi:hypothetical protein
MSACTRRTFLGIRTVGLGGFFLGEGGHCAEVRGGRGRADSCILLYMDGGPSHIDL